MPMKNNYDAMVVGSGPNGLAAAITLAQKGLSVAVIEAENTIGGGMRSAELTLPGFINDVCSAIHPLGLASPFFSKLNLEKHGLQWIQPGIPLAHPFDDGTAAILDRSILHTSELLGQDAGAYRSLFEPLTNHWNKLASDILAPLHVPRHPILLSRFGMVGIRSAHSLTFSSFQTMQAKALFAGLAAHSVMPLDWLLTSAVGLVLGTLGHAVGWPLPRGGSQQIADALADVLRSLGGEIRVNEKIEDLAQLPSSRAILLDTSTKDLLKIAKNHLPEHFQKKVEKYQYGPGIYKMDWALNGPIPWKASECHRAGTVHIGGTFEEIARGEKEVWEGKHPEKPFIIAAQQSLFDSTRAPKGMHTGWAYCHVPHGSNFDMSDRIEKQIERFAPGFRDCIIERKSRTPKIIEHENANFIGGDITGGVQNLHQFLRRPVSWLHPYSTPMKGLYLCSSSTPPGGGVHGMCGYHAASVALKQCFD